MKKRGFTLIELIVVIGILGLLMATLVHYITGGTESARSAQCKTNLKNLHSAFVAVAANDTEYNHYPLAGSAEHMTMSIGQSGGKAHYYEQKGWVSWYSNGAYKNSPSTSVAQGEWVTTAYDTGDRAMYAMTNGAVWSVMGASAESFRCPNHVKAWNARGEKTPPNWSYACNAWFGGDGKVGTGLSSASWGRSVKNTQSDNQKHNLNADKRLLFAELQWSDFEGLQPDFSSSGHKNDGTLHYRGSCKGIEAEAIGFNHKSGDGRDTVAHIVYLSGAVDEITWKDQDLKELTKWLCEASNVAMDPGSDKYKEMK